MWEKGENRSEQMEKWGRPWHTHTHTNLKFTHKTGQIGTKLDQSGPFLRQYFRGFYKVQKYTEIRMLKSPDFSRSALIWPTFDPHLAPLWVRDEDPVQIWPCKRSKRWFLWLFLYQLSHTQRLTDETETEPVAPQKHQSGDKISHVKFSIQIGSD